MANDGTQQLMVMADQSQHIYHLPNDRTMIRELWKLMWSQQDYTPPFQCETLGTLMNFLRLVNAAPTESAALWSLAALPSYHGGVILGRHSTIEWERALLQMLQYVN